MELRNIAIVAHVDHGKTTLVDAILKQTGVFREGKAVERVLDSNDLERERGITILAKNTGVFYRGAKINVVDTPGHADFGGEVERILSMVEGALLVVDAAEGPLPQTRYVLQKALGQGIRPVVVINKIDRTDARPAEVIGEVYDLFIDLGADDAQLEFPIVYASGRAGVTGHTLEETLAALATGEGTVFPLLDTVLAHVAPPSGSPSGPLQMMVTMLDYDEYVGRIVIGRLHNGRLRTGQSVLVGRNAPPYTSARVSQLYTFARLQRVPVEAVEAGEIVALAGIEHVEIGDTIMDPENPQSLPPLSVDEPTLTMIFRVNDGPFAGRDGTYITSRHLRDRLFREARTNVALRVRETDSPEAIEVAGRGELHLGILIETMRREGYEFTVSRPHVITREIDGELHEPMENLTVEVPQAQVGAVMELLGERKAEMLQMQQMSGDGVKLQFLVPARGLLGFSSRLLTETRGYGVMHHTYAGYGPWRGEMPARVNGSLVAWEAGVATAYAIEGIQERGTLFIEPGVEVYEGMIIGENARSQDMDVNVAKKKHVTNMRSSTADIAVKLDAPRRLSLEQALAWIADDELVEVTPKAVRLRKAILSRNQRHQNRSKMVGSGKV